MTLVFVVGFAALAVVLVVTSGKPGRWLERRYWRRRRLRRRQQAEGNQAD